MRRIIMDIFSILTGALAGFTSYLILGFPQGFHTINPMYLVLCTMMGLAGGFVPTLWEIFASSRELSRISHSWLAVIILLALIHTVSDPLWDAAFFGYLFHLFVDTQKQKLAPVMQLKSCNRALAYTLIILLYLAILVYALYAWSHPPMRHY